MILQFTLVLYAGGPGSGCRGANCGRPKFLSQKQIKKEVSRLTPYMYKVADAWRKQIKQIDPKAKVEVSVSPTGLIHFKTVNSPGVLQYTWGVNVYLSGKSGSGERFGIGLGVFPEPNGNTVKIQDSSLPDSWQGKGIFSAGLRYLTENKVFNLSRKMIVHVDTNPKVWTALAKKHGLDYDREH